MLLIDAAYSLLSLNQQANIKALIGDKLIPYIISMMFCIIHIFRHWHSTRIHAPQIINDFLKHKFPEP